MQNEFRQLAKETRQVSAGVSAVKEISILTGHRVEKSDIGGPGEFEALSDEELERELVKEVQALGLLENLAERDTPH